MSQMIRVILGFLGFSFITSLVSKFYFENTTLYAEGRQAPGLSELSSRFGSFITRWMQPVRILSILAVFFAGSMFTTGILLSGIPDSDEVSISAHRGGPPPAPENTLAAAEQAITEGADYTEIDVQRTSDGVVVLLHDADLMRVANDPRRIANVRYDEIRDLVQVPDDGTPAKMRKILTLDELLEHSRGRIIPMIELKYYGADQDLVRDVVQIIQNWEMEDEVVVMSMSLQPLRELRDLAPTIRRGFVSSVAVGDLSRLPVHFLAVNQTQINSGLVRSAQEQDIEMYAWTVNNPDAIMRMINLGVNGIITDFPALAADVRNEMQEMTIAERLMLTLTGWIAPKDNDTEGRADELHELISY